MKFRKLPVVIEAVRFTQAMVDGKEPLPAGVDRRVESRLSSIPDVEYGVQTLEGFMVASPGDWIIKGVKGEFYPCKNDIFEATYELVEL